jgi:hypothetical protein
MRKMISVILAIVLLGICSTASLTFTQSGGFEAADVNTMTGTLAAEFTFTAEQAEELILGYQNLKIAVADNMQPSIDAATSEAERELYT